jgi:hypothetical protein
MLIIMKIALLYSGMPNCTHEVYENHYNHIIRKYDDIDIYYSTYISDSESETNIKTFEKLFQPKKINIEIFENIQKQKLNYLVSLISLTVPEIKPINALSMFYKIKDSFDLIEDAHYNIVIRSRTDIIFNSDLVIDQNNSVNIPSGGDHHGGLMDMLAYGKQELMKKYCSLFDKVKNYFLDKNFVFHPESSLRYHCVKNKINIKRFNYDIFLRGDNFTKSAPYWDNVTEEVKNSKYL